MMTFDVEHVFWVVWPASAWLRVPAAWRLGLPLCRANGTGPGNKDLLAIPKSLDETRPDDRLKSGRR